MTDDKKINYYLEKTFSQNPSDVAHLLKYMYYEYIRYDTKNWYHFTHNHWIKKDEDQSPLISIIKNELVNRYLTLANVYNGDVMKMTSQLNKIETDENYNGDNHDKMDVYLPLLISDLMYKSMVCSELGLKMNTHGYYQKVNAIAQELFTDKDFELSMDLRSNLIGFKNGNYNLNTKKLEIPKANDRVLMSVGYEYNDKSSEEENVIRQEIMNYFDEMNLTKMLPVLANLLSGEVRQPVIWVTNLTNEGMNGIVQLLKWTLGDYVGNLAFSILRRRKIPHHQNHTHSDLVNSCRKRLIMVEQSDDDYAGVYPMMLDTLISEDTLNLRKPYETNNDYKPQFGMIILSTKKDTEPLKDSMIFESKQSENQISKPTETKKEWQQTFMKILLNYYNNGNTPKQ